jgi:hypothetical protein
MSTLIGGHGRKARAADPISGVYLPLGPVKSGPDGGVHKMTHAHQLIYYIDERTMQGQWQSHAPGNQFPCQLQGFAALPQQENSLSPPPPKIPADASGQ